MGIPAIDTPLLQLIWVIIAAALTAMVAVYVLKTLSPILKLTVKSRSVPTNKELIVLELELENSSKVAIPKEIVLLEVIAKPSLQIGSKRSGECFEDETVKFNENDKEKEVFKTTEQVYPGERIHIEKTYVIGPGDVLKVGLQFIGKEPTIKKFPLIGKYYPWPKRWTTTCFVYNQ